MSARRNDKGNKHLQGSPRGLPDTHTSKDRWRTNKRNTDRSTLINQYITAWGSEDDSRGIHGTNGIRIYATAQPRQLLAKDGNLSRARSQNQKFSTKPSASQKIHRCGRRSKNQVVTAVQPVFLSPLVDQLTRFGQVSALAGLQHLFFLLRGDRQNQP